MSAVQNKQKTPKRTLPFATEYQRSVFNLKNIMSKWYLIENQPLLRETLPCFHTEKGGLWKTYSLEQSFKGQSFLILKNGSRVWPVNHLYHHCSAISDVNKMS